MLLEADQGNLPVAQKLLGHTRLKTTEEIYGSRVTLTASRRYGELIREQVTRSPRMRGRQKG